MQQRNSRLVALAVVAATAVGGGAAIAVGAGDEDQSASLAAKIDPSKPKNVILLVGDGMGDSEVSLARYYGKGAQGRLAMDSLPFRGVSVTYGLTPGAGPTFAPNYVPDSAPTATAWSTGKKTQDARLSQGPSSAEDVPGTNDGYKTTIEHWKERGAAIGNVSTAEITDATPAAPSSHISQRKCQGPADARAAGGCPTETKASGGLGSVAEQQVDHGMDVLLGGGRSRFQQTLDGSSTTVLDYAQSKGQRYVSDAAGLDAIGDLSGGPVLGLFSTGNMTKEYAPLDVTLAGSGGSSFRCAEANRPANEPSLTAMTKKAINLLDDDPQGFFLQVEGASIDKQDHAGDVCGQIGETLEFDNAVAAALEFQKRHPDTLVIATADHSHTSQMTYAAQDPEGEFATLQTADGAPVRVSYGTASAEGQSHTHTGATVPIFAVGPQAANVAGTLDQTELFPLLLGKTPSDLPKNTQTKTETVTLTTTVATPVPAVKPGKPAVGVAVLRSLRLSQYRATGLELAVVLRDVTRFKATLKQGTRTVGSNTGAIRGNGSQGIRLRLKKGAKVKKGALKLTLEGTGPAGATKVRRTIKLT
jgi:alkaline phosphatase